MGHAVLFTCRSSRTVCRTIGSQQIPKLIHLISSRRECGRRQLSWFSVRQRFEAEAMIQSTRCVLQHVVCEAACERFGRHSPTSQPVYSERSSSGSVLVLVPNATQKSSRSESLEIWEPPTDEKLRIGQGDAWFSEQRRNNWCARCLDERNRLRTLPNAAPPIGRFCHSASFSVSKASWSMAAPPAQRSDATDGRASHTSELTQR